MLLPTIEDYTQMISHLVEQVEQEYPVAKRRGRLFTYIPRGMLTFFILVYVRRIICLKAQRRWLETHLEMAAKLGFLSLPHRTTQSHQYKVLAPSRQDLIAYMGRWAGGLGEAFSSQ